MANYIHGQNYHLLDIGIACSNIILRAQELNIGSCMVGWFDKEKVRELLKIKQNKDVVAIISLGYFKNKARCRKSRKKISDIVSLRF